MSHIVQFLEDLGATPSRLTATGYAASVNALVLDEASRSALLSRDAAAVHQALGGRTEMRCMIAVAD